MNTAAFHVETLAIAGVGLIGGSIAAAAQQRGLARRVIGYGRNRDRLEQARQKGLINEIATEPQELAAAGLIVVCTPVDRLGADIARFLMATSPSTLITDVGSVKASVVEQASRNALSLERYIPAHPIAGSHLQGFENARADLCQGRLCILSPLPVNRAEDVSLVRSFWQAIGMQVRDLPAEEHDRVLALTSHLPHLAASAVAALIEPPLLEFAATGYRDTTRVAAGDPELWTAIFTENAPELNRATGELIQLLQNFQTAIQTGDRDAIRTFLELGQKRRSHFRDQKRE